MYYIYFMLYTCTMYICNSKCRYVFIFLFPFANLNEVHHDTLYSWNSVESGIKHHNPNPLWSTGNNVHNLTRDWQNVVNKII
jgi:hypothetical protein